MFNLSCVNSKRIHPEDTRNPYNETGGGNVDGVVLVDGFRSNLARLLYDKGVGVVSNEKVRLIARGGKNVGDVMRHGVVRNFGTETSVDAQKEDGVHAERCDRLRVLGINSALAVVLKPHLDAAFGRLQETCQRGTLSHGGKTIRLVKGVLQHRLLGTADLPTRPASRDAFCCV